MLLRMTLLAAIDDCRVRPDGFFPFYTHAQVKNTPKATKEESMVKLYTLDPFIFSREERIAVEPVKLMRS
jgi:hypothetical protein